MAIFGPKPWVKCQFFHFLLESLERRFIALEYRKRDFPGLYCLKKKVGKMAIFEPKPWVNPFWKNVNFFTFWTFCFYSSKRRFFALEYRIRHFSVLYCLK